MYGFTYRKYLEPTDSVRANRMVVTRARGEERTGYYCSMGTELLFGMVKEFQKWIVERVVKYDKCT